MKHLVNKMYNPTNANLGLLVLRITLGSIFLIHGIQKLQNMEGTIGFFGMLGFPVVLAWIVALVESVGGALVILGIGTRIISSFFAIIMIIVIAMVKSGKGFGTIEIELAMLGLSLGVGLIGCGSWSMCRMWHKKDCADCNTNGTCACDCNDVKKKHNK